MSVRPPSQTFSFNPLLWLAASFALGIVLGSVINTSFFAVATAAFSASVFSILLRKFRLATALVLISFFTAGCSFFALEQASVSDDRIRRLFETERLISGEPVEIEGELSGAPEPAPEGYFSLVHSERVRVDDVEVSTSGLVRVFVPLDVDAARSDFANLELTHGSRVRIACIL